MGKLGKKARKFARKHLQSALKQRRKYKSMRDSFRKKHVTKSVDNKGDAAQDCVEATAYQAVGGNPDGVIGNEEIGDIFVGNLGHEVDNSIEDVDSDSDGFLSEDLDCPCISEGENANESEDQGGDHSALMTQNRAIQLEIVKQKRKLDSLKKDPEFSKFLASHVLELLQLGNKEDDYDEGEIRDQSKTRGREALNFQAGMVITRSNIDVWCQMVMEQQSISALRSLLNAYRAACHYGSDEIDLIPCKIIQNSEAFCTILMFVLNKADGIFRRLLGISSSVCKRETILELQNTSRWKTAKPVLKSYLRSTLYLLDQLTDSQILAYAISQLRASITFFSVFPALLERLIKFSVHLWGTGGGALSLVSFFIIRDMASQLNTDCLDSCLMKTYKAFASHCKFGEPTNLKHIQFLADSLVELYSLDMPKSYQKALLFVQQLARILQQALKTKKKEALKKIYNWQFINCIDLWVKLVSANIRDHDLQPLLYLLIQIINGVAHLFPGPRYLPLRLKCIQMLNQLCNCGRVFIPITSLVLDSLEFRESNKGDAGCEKAVNFSSILKVPKQFLKSQEFQEECVLSAIEQLSAHFAQWSYHISFPELASIPLIRLRKFHEKTTFESLRRLVKRLIDQVELNVEFVQKKRDEVAFSPKDEASIESFLQVEKNSGHAPFTQYYASILQKSISRTAAMQEKISVLELGDSRKKQNLEKETASPANKSSEKRSKKKRRI